MALLRRPFLCLLLLPFVWAGPPSTASLTPYLADTTPSCSHDCLQSFISENFPTTVCGPPPNFECLCTSQSTSSLTIGEGALSCLVSSCLALERSDGEAVYEVCSGIPDAIPNTHSTLTATYAATTTDGADSSTSSNSQSDNDQQSSSSSGFPTRSSSTASSTASGKKSFRTAMPTSFLSTSSVQNLPSSSPSSRPSSSSSSAIPPAAASPVAAAPATSSSPPPASPTLTKPQIAAVVVASVGAAALAFGLCFLLLCMRRRKKSRRRHSGSSFGGDKIVDSEGSSPNMAAIAVEDFGSDQHPNNQREASRGQLALVTPANAGDDGWNKWKRNTDPHHIGLAIGPATPQVSNSAPEEPSPTTPASSQLLPDKPTYSLFPPPLRSQSRRASQNFRPPPNNGHASDRISPAPRSIPRFPSSMDTSQAHLQGGPSHRSLSDPFYDNSHALSQYFPYSQSSRQRPRSPPNSRPSPNNVHSGPSADATEAVRKPMPTYRGIPATYRTQQPDLPRTNAPPQPIEQHYLAAIDRSHSRRHPRRNKSTASSQITRFSGGSDTSFEDADIDDFPHPSSALSPVAEVRSPPQNSSSGRVLYPSVPTSAAESPTRVSKKPSFPARSDSLHAKRRGAERVAELPNLRTSPRDVRDTAKWKILVSPGLEGIENGSSSEPNSARTVGPQTRR